MIINKIIIKILIMRMNKITIMNNYNLIIMNKFIIMNNKDNKIYKKL